MDSPELKEVVNDIGAAISTPRRHRRLFHHQVEALWPCDDQIARANQRQAIRAFAAIHGWSVTISDPRIIVTFFPLAAAASVN